jgi:hypothetical protein
VQGSVTAPYVKIQLLFNNTNIWGGGFCKIIAREIKHILYISIFLKTEDREASSSYIHCLPYTVFG